MKELKFSTKYVEELYNTIKENGSGFAKDGYIYAKTELLDKGLCEQNILTGKLYLK